MKKLKKIVGVFLVILPIMFLLALYIANKKHKTRYLPISIELKNVLAYTKHPAYTKGDSISVYVHTTDISMAVLYHLGNKLEETPIRYNIPTTIQSDIYHPVTGCDWKKTITIPTQELASGYYYLKIQQKKDTSQEFFLPILIKPDSLIKIAIVASTNTWQAYNNFGGMSNYSDERRPWYMHRLYFWLDYEDKVYLPFSRPYNFEPSELKNLASPMYNGELKRRRIGAEWSLVSFLEKNKYEYGVFSDFDFSTESHIMDADLIIFHVHSEYWSQDMKGRLQQYLKRGGHVIFASGDNMNREIEYYDGGFFVTKQEADPVQVIQMIGTYYLGAGYLSRAPYKVELPEHWVFSGTSLRKGDELGKPGASGWETDKIGFGSDSFQTLAIGLNEFGPAYMVYKDCENGGWLFNVSSITFNECIEKDKNIGIIYNNLICNALKLNKQLP